VKVLLSAYACEPGKGSEPGVGWRWALEIARLGREVWVLTRANNREPIEEELAKMPPIGNLKFVYFDLPKWARFWKKKNRGMHLYYLLWQWGAYRLACQIHGRERFDRVHHITFGVIRLPSFMGNLGIPFIFGPLGGGETAPWALRAGYGPRGWLRDAVRDISNKMICFDPLMRTTFRQAESIFVKTPESARFIPESYQAKVRCQLEIGIDSRDEEETHEKVRAKESPLRILYVGQFLYLKGMHLGLPAFKKLLSVSPEARLTLLGEGPDEQRWRALAGEMNISKNVDWINWVPQKEVAELYRDHDVLLFPSLHDSSGNVVLEAMACGLPVVCLDLGGPGEMVDDTCGFAVQTAGLNQDNVIQKLADCLIELAEDSDLLCRLGEGALKRVQEFSWQAQVTKLYAPGDNPD
jgi:glycosyltransferase involved in cell wall biosynthesis